MTQQHPMTEDEQAVILMKVIKLREEGRISYRAGLAGALEDLTQTVEDFDSI